MSSSRNFEFTHNNYTQEDINKILNWKCQYVVIGEEIAPTTGTPHLQGYVQFKSSVLWKTVTNKKNKDYGFIDKWCKVSERRCPIEYCKKDGKYHENGSPKAQGNRSDLNDLKDRILNNETTVSDLLVEDANVYHQYGRTLEKLEDLKNRKKFRKWMTECDWRYGETGTGKSEKAFENFDPDTHYVFKNDNGWWDGYNGQETVILNDFRGEIPYGVLLQMIDKYPFEVKRRCREPFPFLAKKVIVTSFGTPSEVYKNLSQNDSLEQIYRRINLIYHEKINEYSSS